MHQENQQEEVLNASTDGKIKKTQPREVKKVPDQKEDDINREEDNLGRHKDDLERQFILESPWFEETTLSSIDHQEDDLQKTPDRNQEGNLHHSTLPDQIEGRRVNPAYKDASTVSTGGDSLADIGARPTTEQTGECNSNHIRERERSVPPRIAC